MRNISLLCSPLSFFSDCLLFVTMTRTVSWEMLAAKPYLENVIDSLRNVVKSRKARAGHY